MQSAIWNLVFFLAAVEVKGDLVKTLPISELQLEKLAERVCFYIHQNIDEEDERAMCEKTFPQPSNTSSHESEAQMTSRKEKLVEIQVSPSEDLQLIVLIPSNNPNAMINYGIVRSRKTSIKIETRAQKNLQIWSTTLDESGRAGLWRIGPKIPDWKERPPYEVKLLGDFELDADSKAIKAVFGWTNADGTNFTVKNNCHVPGEEIDIVTNASNYSIHGLRLNKLCEISVADDYGHGTLRYQVPECVQTLCVLQRPSGLAVYTDDVGGGVYDVTVTWDRPRRSPGSYNVTVKANTTHHVPVDGNSTSVVVQNVKGSGIFTVTVTAIPNAGLDIKPQRATARAIFIPNSEESSSFGVIVVGSVCGVLLAGITAVGIALWVRARSRNHFRRKYFMHDLDFELPKELGAESLLCSASFVEDKWEVGPERLLLHQVVGEGAFGVVRKGVLQPPGKEVGVKMLKDRPSVEEIRSFRAEMELMKSVGAHPHVVSLVGCCSRRRLMIVSEYCSRGDLLNFLRCALDIMVSKRNAKYYNNNIEYSAEYRNDLFKKPQMDPKFVTNKLYDLQGVCDTELTAVDLLSFCRQIAMGMEFLSSNRVVHRDLAARNVLVTSDRTLKIADFGLSRDVYQENQYKQKGSGKLPIKWMALESLVDKIYTSQSDVWSFGIVIWEVVTVGGSPYPGVSPAHLLRLLRSGYRMPRPNNCSKPLYEIMQSCWRERARDRPTFAELHRQLDALLNSACADDYLTLDVDGDYAPPTPKMPRYMGLIAKTKRYWSHKTEVYEKPLKTSSNHYTSPPDTLSRTQVV